MAHCRAPSNLVILRAIEDLQEGALPTLVKLPSDARARNEQPQFPTLPFIVRGYVASYCCLWHGVVETGRTLSPRSVDLNTGSVLN